MKTKDDKMYLDMVKKDISYEVSKGKFHYGFIDLIPKEIILKIESEEDGKKCLDDYLNWKSTELERILNGI